MNLSYTSITLNGVSVALSGAIKGSFISPYNKVVVKFISTDGDSIDRYLVRVTKAGEDYDIDLGTLPVSLTNLAAGVTHTAEININNTYFNKGDGSYRVSLYAKSAGTGRWDVTYLFMVFNETKTTHINYVPDGTDGYAVTTYDNI